AAPSTSLPSLPDALPICRTRSDSVRVVEALVTATPEFFQGKKKSEIRAYFQEALNFLQQNQDPKTIISAVVHMDEKTPHMHLSRSEEHTSELQSRFDLVC